MGSDGRMLQNEINFHRGVGVSIWRFQFVRIEHR